MLAEPRAANAFVRESLALFRELAREMNDRLLMATMLPLVAASTGVAGKPGSAARLLGASEGALQRMEAFQQLNDKRELEEAVAEPLA
jgi:hypothetical protein